jgi:hypothetical protein
MDCHVASLPRNDGGGCVATHLIPLLRRGAVGRGGFVLQDFM